MEVSLTGDGHPQKVQSFKVSANLFGMLGVQPQLGRVFSQDEEEPGKIRKSFLAMRFGSSVTPLIPHLRQHVKVGGKAYTVVGSCQKASTSHASRGLDSCWRLNGKDRERRDIRWLWVLGRLKPHVSFSEASAEMQGIAQRQAEAYPDTNKGWQLRPMPLANS